MILYLDIDGVLNNLCSRGETSAELHQGNVAAYNKLVRMLNFNKIVLSSSWRHYVYSKEICLEGLQLLLRTHGVHHTGLIKEMLPKDAHEGFDRGISIVEYHQNSKEFALVLDDLPLNIQHKNIYFYQTNPKEGLDFFAVDKICKEVEGFTREYYG